MYNVNEAIIVSVDFHADGHGVLIVGRQKNGKVDVINAFSGDEAWAMYHKLVTRKEKK